MGADIQKNNRDSIDRTLRIPKHIRIEWGIYRNLLNGITTVVHHGEYISPGDPLITVFQENYPLHSVDREKLWKIKLNRPFARKQPFVIHAGEGTDRASFEEINELVKWNLFKRKLVAIHGVAMDIEQAKAFEAVVWCPASNIFLLNATAKINELKSYTRILFGTDSTLTGPWNIWEQLRQARGTKLVSETELFAMLTINASKTWGMNRTGVIAEGAMADIVIADGGKKTTGWDQFYDLNPENLLMVICRGAIRLFDVKLLEQLKDIVRIGEYSKITIKGRDKYVKGDLKKLREQTRSFDPGVDFPFEIR